MQKEGRGDELLTTGHHNMTTSTSSSDADEYEEPPGIKGSTGYLISGAMAGVTEHTIMYPVDTIKVRRIELLQEEIDLTCGASRHACRHCDLRGKVDIAGWDTPCMMWSLSKGSDPRIRAHPPWFSVPLRHMRYI